MAMATHLTRPQHLRLRTRAQRLDPAHPLASAAEVAAALCGLQSQEPAAADLGVRARSAGATAEDVVRARDVDRSVVQTWSLRGTLHLHAAEDVRWLVALIGPVALARQRRRREQLGLDAETCRRAIAAMRRRLADGAPATRQELREALAARGIDTEGQRLAQLLSFAGFSGEICAGPGRGRAQTYVALDAWVPSRDVPSAAESLARLAARYLAAYAPARPADLAVWSGLPTASARAAWRAVESDLEPVEVEGERAPLWMPRSHAQWLDDDGAAPVVRLLPRFDTYTLGHRTRDLIDPLDGWKRVNAGGGILHPVIVVDGVLRGVWRLRRTGKRLEIGLEPFEPLRRGVLRQARREIADIGRFLDVDAALVPAAG